MTRWLVAMGLLLTLLLSCGSWLSSALKRRRARRAQGPTAEILFFSRYMPRGQGGAASRDSRIEGNP
jgi:hypothetical protein